jgi:hypothetical protein
MHANPFRNATLGLALGLITLSPALAQQAAKPTVDFTGVYNPRLPSGNKPQSEYSTEVLPFTAKGQAAFDANKPGKGPRQRPPALGNDPIGGANPNGLYRTLIYPRPVEIVQLPGKIIQMFEWGRVYRIIYTDGRPVPADVPTAPLWFGYSVGHWEGDTLVVTTIGLDERAWFDEWGTPFTGDAKVEERWQRTAPDRFQIKVTVTDPAYYSKPWTSGAITYVQAAKDVEPIEIIMAPMDEAVFNERIRNPAGLPAK